MVNYFMIGNAVSYTSVCGRIAIILFVLDSLVNLLTIAVT